MGGFRHPCLDKAWRPGFQVHNEAVSKTVGACIDNSWRVSFACENGHSGGWSAGEIGGVFPRAVLLDDIAERLVCKTCGSKEGSLTILNDTGEQQRRDIERFSRKGLGASAPPEAG